MGFQESTKRKPKKFELLQHYPMSWRYIVRSNLGWLLVFATVLIFYILLLRVTEVYKKRTFRDFLLGLAYLSVSTATETSSRFAKIEGLSLAAASGLQRTILEMALKVQDPEQNQ